VTVRIADTPIDYRHRSREAPVFTRTSIAAIYCLGWFAGSLNEIPTPRDGPPKHGPIDPGTIGVYEKLGAAYGGFDVDEFGSVQFSQRKDAAAKGLPGFQLAPQRDGGLPQLPSVEVAFGLELSGRPVTDAGLKELKKLKNLTSLDLWGTQVTDASLKVLKDLKNLTSLNLGNTHVTNAGLKDLKHLKNLTSLNLEATKVTDAGLKELKDIKNLASLSFGATQVTDADLKELKALKNLTSLTLQPRK
jgi:Leucine rich repeat